MHSKRRWFFPVRGRRTVDLAQTTAKLIKFESDVDPPDVNAFSAGISLQFSTAASVFVADHAGEANGAGSTTYLITQRLRI